MEKLLTEPSQALEFILGGNATTTLVGASNRYTYKIKKAKKGDIYFVSVLVGGNNETDYKYIGCISDSKGYFTTAKSGFVGMAQSLAFGFVYSRLKQGIIDSRTQVWHEGKCGRCGRKLTTPQSIDIGFGAECIRLMEG
ncbi:MAG: DUF6011 domain-containing protein [Sediminibacterium sp.]